MNRETDAVFLQTLGKFISAQVQLATTPLLQKIDQLEKTISQLKDVQDIALTDHENVTRELDGAIEGFAAEIARVEKQFESVITPSAVAAIAEGVCDARIAALPKPENGKDGKDAVVDYDQIGDAIEMKIRNEIEKFTVCDGKDGAPGRDGKDGVDGKDGKAGDPGRDGADVVAAFRDSDRHLVLTLSNGVVKDIGMIHGADGAPGKDGARGKDGLGIKELAVEHDGERTFTFKHICDDGTHDERSFRVPATIFRGIWREGLPYQRGDHVTKGGSSFIALDDTDSVPETKDCKWQLFVKRGDPGKTGAKGEPGDAGRHGRDGRDLTQMGFDGKKY